MTNRIPAPLRSTSEKDCAVLRWKNQWIMSSTRFWRRTTHAAPHSTLFRLQFAFLLRNIGPARFYMSNLPGPVPKETATVPIDDGIRFHDDKCGAPASPESRQPNPIGADLPISVLASESFVAER